MRPRRSLARASRASLCLALLAGPARAQLFAPPPESTLGPQRFAWDVPAAEAEARIREAELLLFALEAEQDLSSTDEVPTRGPLLHAIDLRLRAALSSAPEHVGALALRARWLAQRHEYEQEAQVLARALALVGEGPALLGLLTSSAVVATRLGRFDRAREFYERALTLPLERPQRAVLLANLAEVLMGLGSLVESIAMYRAALAQTSRPESALWGLAVACDRDGRASESAQALADALRADPRLEGIGGWGVFFAPAWEVHYYLALALEARGSREAARLEWSRFLDQGGAGGPWAARASAHLASLSDPPIRQTPSRAARPDARGTSDPPARAGSASGPARRAR